MQRLDQLQSDMSRFGRSKITVVAKLLLAALLIVVGGRSEAFCIPIDMPHANASTTMQNCDETAAALVAQDHEPPAPTPTHDQIAMCHLACVTLFAEPLTNSSYNPLSSTTYVIAQQSPLFGVNRIPLIPPPRFG